MNTGDTVKEVVEIVRNVAQFIQKESEGFTLEDAEQKGKNDLVSYVDKTAEKMLVEKLVALLPKSGVLAEEGTHVKAPVMWIIDPLDGTTNFVHGVPTYAISVALKEDDEVILGVVYEINRGEAFYAWKDGGAYLNGQKIHVSTSDRVKDCLVATGFPVQNFDRIGSYLKLVENLIRNSHGLRRVGSAATDLAYVACGRYDAFFEYNLSPWDVAAGSLLVKEAGGTVTDYKGSEDFIFGRQILAAGGIHPYMLKTIQEYWE